MRSNPSNRCDARRGESENAIGTLYLLYSPEVFTALTRDLGWSIKRYERWLADMLYRTVTCEDGST